MMHVFTINNSTKLSESLKRVKHHYHFTVDRHTAYVIQEALYEGVISTD